MRRPFLAGRRAKRGQENVRKRVRDSLAIGNREDEFVFGVWFSGADAPSGITQPARRKLQQPPATTLTVRSKSQPTCSRETAHGVQRPSRGFRRRQGRDDPHTRIPSPKRRKEYRPWWICTTNTPQLFPLRSRGPAKSLRPLAYDCPFLARAPTAWHALRLEGFPNQSSQRAATIEFENERDVVAG